MLEMLLMPVVYKSLDRKSTRLNSSHGYISYADLCLNKARLEVLIGLHRCAAVSDGLWLSVRRAGQAVLSVPSFEAVSPLATSPQYHSFSQEGAARVLQPFPTRRSSD